MKIRKYAAGHLRDQHTLSSWLEDDRLSDLVGLLYGKGILTKHDIATLLGENLLETSPAPGYGIEIIDEKKGLAIDMDALHEEARHEDRVRWADGVVRRRMQDDANKTRDPMTQSRFPPRVDEPDLEKSPPAKPRIIAEESRARELAEVIFRYLDVGFSDDLAWGLIAEWAGKLRERAQWLAEQAGDAK